MSIGRIIVDLLAKTGSFDTDINRSAKLAEKRAREMDRAFFNAGKTIGSNLKSLGAQFLAFAGVTASVGAAFSGLKSAIDSADQVRDLSIRLGVGTEALSGYSYAAKQTGTDIDELGKGFLKLSRFATDALDPKSSQAGFIDALGISRDSLTDLNKLVPQVADSFRGMQDGATKAAIAQELFGRSGANLIEFLNLGSDGLQKMAERAAELGIVIDGDTAAAADDFNDKLADLKTSAQGLALQVAEQLLPKLSELVDWATDFVSNGSNAERIANEIASGFEAMTEAGAVLADVLDRLGSVRQFFADLENWNINSFVGKTLSIGDALKSTFPWLYREIGGGKKQDWSGVSAAVDTTADTTPTLDPVIVTPGGDALKKFLSGGSDGESRKKAASKATKELTEAEKAYREVMETNAMIDDLVADARSEQVSLEYEKAKAIEQGIKSADQQIDDMRFELELIGMSNVEREKAIALRYADVNATDEQRQAIADLAVQMEQSREWQEIMDGWQGAAADAFGDFLSGASSAKDAFSGLVDSLKRQAAQFLADKAIQALFDFFSGGGTGSGGAAGSGGWAGLITSIFGSFGGARAGGGSVAMGSTYLVGERGPELFRPNTSGQIIPNGALNGFAASEREVKVNVIAVYSEEEARSQALAAMKSSAGERVTVTHFQRNKKAF